MRRIRIQYSSVARLLQSNLSAILSTKLKNIEELSGLFCKVPPVQYFNIFAALLKSQNLTQNELEKSSLRVVVRF